MCAEKKAPHPSGHFGPRSNEVSVYFTSYCKRRERRKKGALPSGDLKKKNNTHFMRAAMVAALEQSGGMEQRRLESVKDICIHPSPLSNEKL